MTDQLTPQELDRLERRAQDAAQRPGVGDWPDLGDPIDAALILEANPRRLVSLIAELRLYRPKQEKSADMSGDAS